MFKKITELLTKNVLWKLLSLLLAVLMWFIVVNDANPITAKWFKVPLYILNEDKLDGNSYTILNKSEILDTEVEMYVRGSKSVIDEITASPSGLGAYIDLKPIDISRSGILGEPLPITVKYDVPNSYCEIVRHSPDTVDIVLDEKAERTIPITLEKTGDVASGYIAQPPEVEPQSVKVSGPMTVLRSIASVVANVNLTNSTSDINSTDTLKVKDFSNRDITDKLTLSTKHANVHVQVNKYGRIPIAQPVMSDIIAEGYSVTSIDFEPKFVDAVGDGDIINSLKEIKLPAISVANLTETKAFTFNLSEILAGLNLSTKAQTQDSAVVTVNVERILTQLFSVPPSKVLIHGTSMRYDLQNSNISVLINGLESQVSAMTADKISLSVDLSDLEPGEHIVPVTVELIEGISLVGDPPTIRVHILDPSAALPPTPTAGVGRLIVY